MASSLRQDVVGDVESSLQEHAVQAVVYDQRMKVTGEIQDLAEKYNISYGKAYFLRELIRDNDLTENDMKKFCRYDDGRDCAGDRGSCLYGRLFEDGQHH